MSSAGLPILVIGWSTPASSTENQRSRPRAEGVPSSSCDVATDYHRFLRHSQVEKSLRGALPPGVVRRIKYNGR
jgi:hypothetical protein